MAKDKTLWRPPGRLRRWADDKLTRFWCWIRRHPVKSDPTYVTCLICKRVWWRT